MLPVYLENEITVVTPVFCKDLKKVQWKALFPQLYPLTYPTGPDISVESTTP